MSLIYLFDASSIVRALKEVKLVPLGGQALQWLTVYEVINAFWKEVYLLHKLNPEEVNSLISDFIELLKEMIILEPKELEQDILEFAISKGITVYDASYIILALKYDLTLVTEDRKLTKIANSIIRVVSLNEII